MPLLIPDEMLNAAGLSERDARIQIACDWFDSEKLSFGHAAKFAGISELEFEKELQVRGVPRYRYTAEDLENDVQSLKKLGRW